jgi:hypothetical protein
VELIVLALPLALVGAALGRWTRLHPLLAGAVIGLLPAALGALTMAGFFAGGATILIVAGMCFVVGGGIGALGAFGGWLRRTNVERTR